MLTEPLDGVTVDEEARTQAGFFGVGAFEIIVNFHELVF